MPRRFAAVILAPMSTTCFSSDDVIGRSCDERVAALLSGLSRDAEDAADDDASAPAWREVSELDAASILPGVPFS
jgi:hypothetical protein